jgi:low temperature requirement protein LtrA
MRNLLRSRDEGEAEVSPVELFFDLVFVFAVTQLSHALLAHLTLLGALQTAMLFLGSWWVWIFTTWVTNWLDPDRTPVRLMLFALTAAGLFMSMAIPEAFGERGLVFAFAYVAIQVGRSVFMVAALKGHSPENYRNFQRITVWLVGSGIFWIAGGFAEGEVRLGLWALALLIEYVAPAVGFAVPGLGRSSTRDWDVEGHHLAERCGLFIIIALGESILITGATFAEGSWSAPTIGALVAALGGSIAMWWLYFNIGAERAAQKISSDEDPGQVARLLYTYIHLLIVGGIIVSAAGDELVLAHPTGHTSTSTSIIVLGSSAAFLLGNLLFKRATWRLWPLSHLAGLAMLGGLGFAAPSVAPTILALSASAVLVVVAVWETRSFQPK